VKNGLPQSGNTASPTFSEKIRNPLNLYLHYSVQIMRYCTVMYTLKLFVDRKITVFITDIHSTLTGTKNDSL
jgi:hypothetical protein